MLALEFLTVTSGGYTISIYPPIGIANTFVKLIQILISENAFQLSFEIVMFEIWEGIEVVTLYVAIWVLIVNPEESWNWRSKDSDDLNDWGFWYPWIENLTVESSEIFEEALILITVILFKVRQVRLVAREEMPLHIGEVGAPTELGALILIRSPIIKGLEGTKVKV